MLAPGSIRGAIGALGPQQPFHVQNGPPAIEISRLRDQLAADSRRCQTSPKLLWPASLSSASSLAIRQRADPQSFGLLLNLTHFWRPL
ncbi:hypothetical protein VTN02DRAFT_6715 [Thermoascus thermophilus]